MKYVWKIVAIILLCGVIAHCIDNLIEGGLRMMIKRAPRSFRDAVFEIISLPYKVLKTLVDQLLILFKQVLFSIMQIPLDIAWGTIPALATIPKPTVRDLIGDGNNI